MADIKTRDAVKGTIKTIDKAAIASERMKSAYVEIKERAEQGYYADENSATEYAADRISYAADRVKDEGIHQFNKQGQKAVKTTQENIGKAKDKISDFKQSRAVKAAEQKAIQNMSEQHGLQIRHGVASRSTASDVSQTAKSQLIKTRQQGRKMIKTTARNAEKAVKSTAKGTVKTTEKGIKTAQATSKAAIKTTETSVKTAQAVAKASAKTAQKAAQAAKATAKATAEATKATVRATIAAVKASIAGTKALISALIAGGWIAVVIILIVVLLGCAVSLFGGGSGSNAYTPVSAEVEAYTPLIQKYAKQYGIPEYVELIKAVMMQESGGLVPDVMQAAEGAFNTKYPHAPNGITDPIYSIACGIQELKYALQKAGCTGPTDLDRIKLALQGYNYGSGYIDWAIARDGGYTKENAIAYSDMMCARPNWHYSIYGDKEYVDHVLRYYTITSASGGSYPANGMQIPHYLQTDYGNVPYGGGSIASSGCGPTSFAMIASYLTGTQITPIDAVAWCGNSYYMPGVGTYWSYFQAAASHFGCGTVIQTGDPNAVLRALSEGHPVISSQRAGLFTSGGHFIVLRGVTASGKVLVNDPNDSTSKNYINREFDMMSEIHSTANAYWIFDKKK